MGIFHNLFKNLILPKSSQDGIWITIQCAHCGERLRIRINPSADLVPESGETPGSVYTLHKEAMDTKCYRIIKIYLEFDANRNIIMQDIQGGRFINKDSGEK
ncbi:MAG: hypothetical protein ACE14V_14810 [bacterium]